MRCARSQDCRRRGALIAVLSLATVACRTGAPAWIRQDMVPIPSGSFVMGSDATDANENEKPAHRVAVAGFRIDRTEVTVRAYHACVAAGKCTPPDAYVAEKGNYRVFCNWAHPESRDHHPINCVDYKQAGAFCAWAGKRLPTEEEWEFAARGGGEDRAFPWGNEPPTERHLNACGTECPGNLIAKRFPGGHALFPASDGWPETSPVGTFPAGATRHGILDMAGNVWEWTSSQYANYDGSHRDDKRVLRGGSWGGGDAHTERTTNRFRLGEGSRAQFLGFRCAR